jgi:vacuolar-type H+-ATPase subunit F/Vma7
MRREIVVVGGADELAGFRLAGVSQTYDFRMPGLADVLSKKEAVIFLSAEAKERLKADMERITARNIVQEMPSSGGYKRVRQIIKDTLGFDLK